MNKTNKNSIFLILDIGGTNINFGLVNHNNEVLFSNDFTTNSKRKKEDILEEIFNKISLLKEFKQNKIKAICVGLPGWIDYKSNYLIKAPNIPGWEKTDVSRIFSDKFKIPTIINNDGNLYTLGEWKTGSGQTFENLVGVTLGTGVGGGLILNSQLWYGSFFSSSEIGHMIIDPNSTIKCNCNNYGCLETISSATGLVKYAKKQIKNGQKTQYQDSPENLTAQTLFNLAENNDDLALNAFHKLGEGLGLALANIFNLLGLEAAIIGGGVAKAYHLFYPTLWKTFSKHVLIANPHEIKILKGLLGKNAPLIGGATLLKKHGY